jgi:alpha-tubulin suppressor-like RCC1 family protein
MLMTTKPTGAGRWRNAVIVVFAVISLLFSASAVAALPRPVGEQDPALAAGGSGTLPMMELSQSDTVVPAPATGDMQPLASSLITPLSPTRAVDTRGGSPLQAGWVGTAVIGGLFGVPLTAAGVVLNVTATQPVGGGHLRVYPCGQAVPNASTLNYAAGASVANSSIIALGTQGKICIYSPTQTHVIVDVTGYFPAGAALSTLPPVRVADTRAGQPVAFPVTKVPLGGGATLQVPIGGASGVPANASAVVVNVTATQPVGGGHLRVYPCGQAVPNASTLNYGAGASVAAGAIVGLGSNGRICVYSPTQTHVLVDVSGYFPAGAPYSPLMPVRAVDTRTGQAVPSGWALSVVIGGSYGVPASAAAVVVNVTATQPVGGGHLRVYPCGQAVPNASTLNYGAGASVANSAIVALGTAGKVCVYTPTTTHIIVDVTGYFPDGSAPLPVATTVAAGSQHTCAIMADRTVKCWGDNFWRQLGDGTKTDRHTPVTVVGVSGATAISAGDRHTCALVTGGQVKCWGDNGYGALGDGTLTVRLKPVAVAGLSGATGITLGSFHSCAIVGGQVKCWGFNGYGQIGDGTKTNRPAPVSVAGLSGVTALGAGTNHTCAVLTGGSAKCWGKNLWGQLGDGTDADRYTPVAVSSLTGVAEITAGEEFTCALLTNGQAKCWGGNKEGQLGNGTVTQSKTAVTVVGLTGATHIAAGYANACALMGNGQAKCWGNNYNGAIGDGTTTNRSTPVTVSGLSDGKSLAAGSAHIVVLRQSGQLKAWGWNSRGQVGDGSITTRLTPVSVVGIG